jgi:uncharacterized protein
MISFSQSATPETVWRVAALTMMSRKTLNAALSSSEAVTWVEASAICNIPEAQVRLGRMLLSGEGVKQNQQRAFMCFRDAAGQGHIEAHNMLGRCYENGWGTKIDYSAAAQEYRLAAEAGLDWAQYNLGHMLLSGSGAARDRSAAFTWYSLAAAQGHIRAMNLVGRCYEEGWGVESSPAAVHEWFRRSAKGGYFRGCYNYASVLAEQGCIIGALYWFRSALRTAPEPTRGNMVTALTQHKDADIRALGHVLSQ